MYLGEISNLLIFFFFFSESVKALLGKRVKILLKNVVRLETKGDKTENRVLVGSSTFVFKYTNIHYLQFLVSSLS